MKNLKLISSTLFLFLFVTVASFSQSGIFFGLGAGFPMAEFADNDINSETAGCAATGINFDINYIYSFSESGLGLFGGLDLFYNGLRADVINNIKKEYESMGIHDAVYKFYSYINIPVSFGLNYSQKIKQDVFLFTNIGIAADYLKITTMSIKIGDQEALMKFKPDINMAFKIGGGLIIDKTSISVNYYGLGEHNVKGTISGGGNTQNFDGKQKTGILALTLGIKI